MVEIVAYFNVEIFAFLKCIYCVLIGTIKDWDKMHGETVKNKWRFIAETCGTVNVKE